MMHSAISRPFDEAEAHALADRLTEDDALACLAVDVTEIADNRWQVVAYFLAPPDVISLQTAAREAGITDARFVLAPVPDADWVAISQAALPPVRVGRFLIHGSHDRAARHANDIAIEIDAGQAFGTGHHGTTVGCLAAMVRLARARRFHRVLDLGTGTGVLAIAAARLWRAPVLASDIDPRAVAIAKENARANGVGPLVTNVTAAGFSHRAFAARRPFDLIVANILAAPLVGLATDLARHLTPDGTAILSGLLTAQTQTVLAAYRGRGLRFRAAITRGDWTTLVVSGPARGR